MTIGERINGKPQHPDRPVWDVYEQLGWLLSLMGGEDESTSDWDGTDPRWRDYVAEIMKFVPMEEVGTGISPCEANYDKRHLCNRDSANV